jgi:hypothetical protein
LVGRPGDTCPPAPRLLRGCAARSYRLVAATGPAAARRRRRLWRPSHAQRAGRWQDHPTPPLRRAEQGGTGYRRPSLPVVGSDGSVERIKGSVDERAARRTAVGLGEGPHKDRLNCTRPTGTCRFVSSIARRERHPVVHALSIDATQRGPPTSKTH